MTEATTPETTPKHGGPSPVLIMFLIFPILGIAAAIITAASSMGGGPAPATPAPVTLELVSLVDKPAPNFELTGLDGSSYRLSGFRGRVVFLNFWATWCEPCQRELPAFQQFSAAQPKDGPIILAVNVAETADTVKNFLAEHQVDALTVLLDAKQDVFSAYNIDRMPTTYVIDKTGVVRYKHYGEMKADDIAAYLAELNKQ
jgi:peroxiredoxin